MSSFTAGVVCCVSFYFVILKQGSLIFYEFCPLNLIINGITIDDSSERRERKSLGNIPLCNQDAVDAKEGNLLTYSKVNSTAQACFH